jgi:hypothetical protein
MSNKIAFNPQDRFVVPLGNRIAVITQDGSVFGHEVSGHDVGAPFKFTDFKAAFNRLVDRFVFTISNMLIVTTRNGDAFGHDTSGRDVGQPFKLNPQDLRLQLFERVVTNSVEVVGDGFTGGSGVKVIHQFETVGLDGVKHFTQGDAVKSADSSGHFDRFTFSLPGKNFNIQARAIDVATGRNVESEVLRPQV